MKIYHTSGIQTIIFLLAALQGACDDHKTPNLQIIGDILPKEVFVIRISSFERPVIFCQRLNVSVRTQAGLEDAPRPVEIEMRSGTSHKWIPYTADLSDLAVAFSPVFLKPHEHRDFRVRLESVGEYRFILRYTNNAEAGECPTLSHPKAVFRTVKVPAVSTAD